MIQEAEHEGKLRPGQCVVELTSGNTGTGLAIVCAITGHPCCLVMSRGNSMERARMMEALGAEVVLVDQQPGSVAGQVSGDDLKLVFECASEIVHERDAFRADQFELNSNLKAHYLHTGPEIWKQSNGKIDVFADFAGTGGTYAGVAKFLKETNPNVKTYIVEPAGCPVIATASLPNGQAPTSTADPSHRIQGGGYSITPLTMLSGHEEYTDGYLQVTDEHAMECARRLAREEGIFGGFSAGANLAAALQLLEGEHAGSTIVICICDSGLKYLSTDLWPSSIQAL
mmetsp:Transcript_59123/g.87812  ORF Transcript_59123/g.87812 Transcript_59123/m.87812 type:complete len:285 (-) Transcript_59123:104-958(-)